jgi:protein TonB
MKNRCLSVIGAAIIGVVIFASAFLFAQQAGSEGSGATSETQKAAPSQRVRVSQGVMSGLLSSRVQPTYPEDAKQAGIQGKVVLKALIDKEGNVEDVQLMSGPEQLAPAAIEAVKQWRYKPYRMNGEPVNVETQVLVNFSLSKH